MRDERWLWDDERRGAGRGGGFFAAARVDVALGVLLGFALAASLAAGWRLVRAPRVQDPSSSAMQGAVHAATSLLPHLRRGLEAGSAPAAPHLLTLTGATAIAVADSERLLAFNGVGGDHDHSLAALVGEVRDDRVRVEPRLHCEHPGCPLRSAIVAPLTVQDRRIGALVAFYDRPGRLRLEETRVVGEAAALVSAMVELSEFEAQGERLARAELRALRAQISPHFIYNALAAVAAFIHSRPEEARELLIEFSEFIRYAFARQRPYVTLAVELRVSDDGAGIDPERAAAALAGRGPGIGLGNVHGRLQSTFGEGYGLVVENSDGTTVVMTLPKFRAGVRAG